MNFVIDPTDEGPVALRAMWNYDRDEASLANGIDCGIDPVTGEILPSMTQQQFAEEVDINTIVRRFGLTGQLPETVRVPMSGDFTGVTDYQTAMQAVRQAEEKFMELPATLRARFRHDPQELMTFMADEKNRAEAEKLGLVNKPPEKTRDVVQAVDELAARMPPIAK